MTLEPKSGQLDGRASFSLPASERVLDADNRLRVRLHPDLVLRSIRGLGRELAFERFSDPDTSDGVAASRYLVAVDEPSGVLRLDLEWSGTLRQDLAAGEKAGQIHNREMNAHIGSDGVYLAPDASWHPRLDIPCIWTLEVTAPHAVVASGDLLEETASTSRWRPRFPLIGMALVGGEHEVHRSERDGHVLRAHVSAGSARFVAGLFDAVWAYLDLYEPLIGPYPFAQFTVVENFFSSGFAFPGFTLLSSQVIRMGERSLRPGYLDHELLHNWWGNGVLPLKDGSHWAEALASYGANYMRPLLEGDPTRGRIFRRNVVETLSRSERLARQAVADFGRADGISGFIGYQKGAVVLDQLADEIGQETLWAGLRRATTERLGRPTDWTDFRATFEAESGRDLGPFFEYWVDGPGLPRITIDDASWHAGELMLHTTSDAPFATRLPVRVRSGSDTVQPTLVVEPGSATSRLAMVNAPAEIEIDPDFEVLRRYPQHLLMPTLAAVAPGEPTTLIVGASDDAAYSAVRDAIEEPFRDSGGLNIRSKFRSRWLDRGSVVLLGREALTEEAADLFDGKLEVFEGGFEVASIRYVSNSDAILGCVRNPVRAGSVVCVFCANGAAALRQAALLTFYGGNSLVIFDHGRPTVRHDFELRETVQVSQS
ncbi:MAG: hypothetical protein VYE73_18345 [Acidobacteriota bacterium]|nr:hypothetical protein [Acidobacteriota bacterium]